MDKDVVVDANIFGHSINPNNNYFDSAQAVLVKIISEKLVIAIDDSGKNAPVLDTSHMYREYEPFLIAGSVGRILIENAALSGRITFLPRLKDPHKSTCRKLVPRNSRDQIVLGVGVISYSKIVVSNDFDDFDEGVRCEAEAQLGVRLLDSSEYHENPT